MSAAEKGKPVKKRNYRKYNKELFKIVVPPPVLISLKNGEKTKKSQIKCTAGAGPLFDMFTEQFIEQILEDWSVYAVKASLKTMKDKEIASVIATRWLTPPVAEWNIHEFGKRAVETFLLAQEKRKAERLKIKTQDSPSVPSTSSSASLSQLPGGGVETGRAGQIESSSPTTNSNTGARKRKSRTSTGSTSAPGKHSRSKRGSGSSKRGRRKGGKEG